MTIIIIIIIIIAVALVLPIIYLLTLAGNYKITRSITINKDAKTIFNKIIDFKSWQGWLPWLIHEPDTKIEYSKDYDKENGFYNWDGKIVGAGKITHVKFLLYSKIEQRIDFLKPFKSTNKIGWDFEEVNKKTKVSWTMEGKMPFFCRFMVKKLIVDISKDYDFGLTMLNGKVDSKAEYPLISFDKEAKLEEQKCLTKSYAGPFAEMPKAMKKGFSELFTHFKEAKIKQAGIPLSVYHKMDAKKTKVVCDMAIPIAGDVDLGNFKIKNYAGGKYLKCNLKGDYKFLETAWRVVFVHLKMNKMKFNWRKPCLEIYTKNPMEVENSNNLETDIYVPLK